MKKYRIDLEKIGSYKETLDNQDYKCTEEELASYFDDLCKEDERVNKDEYCLMLVDNETDEVIYRL